ncbi:MAG: anthranilate synthase component I family protein [Candidatus Bathyarchaeia archaeon]|nr:anthranilate synthase component I family protein [Candidatus Bathyarchaeota archaeon]
MSDLPSTLRPASNLSEPIKFRKIPYESPVDIFLRIYGSYEYAFLLESLSSSSSGEAARFSFIGFDPDIIVSVRDGVAIIDGERFKVSDPLEPIKALLKARETLNAFKYVGGAVGYISYDAIRYWEELPNSSVDDLHFPDLEMGIYSDGIIFDHEKHEAFYFYRGKSRYDEILAQINKPVEIQGLDFTTLRVNIEGDRYNRMIERAKEYIYSGDVIQVVLSKRFSANFRGEFEKFYLNLRRINPSPYMFFVKMGKHLIIGSSPETLVRIKDGIVETCPIAGTRPVTGDPNRDMLLENEMLSDPKEIAEHLMLLDLARNDIGRISEYGSVRVTEFMKVYKYSHVQHIVSKVVGKLRNGLSCFDALKAAFPAGTVSGAPRVRAMEIIEELEGFRRGPYAGAVGYFSYNGNMDFAIIIRALFAKDGRFHIQVGSGVVADSTPEGEWIETEFKAKALIKALEGAE